MKKQRKTGAGRPKTLAEYKKQRLTISLLPSVLVAIKEKSEISGSSVSQLIEDALANFISGQTNPITLDQAHQEEVVKAAIKAAFRDAFGA